MRKTPCAFACFAAAALCGCRGAFPEYQRPDDAVPAGMVFRDAENIAPETRPDAGTPDGADDSVAALPWREFFSDERLRALIEKGLERNADARLVEQRIAEAEAVFERSRAAWQPEIALGVSANARGRRGDVGSAETYFAGASASWEIDAFGKNANAEKGALAALEAERSRGQSVRTRLIAAIAENYFTLLMLDEQLGVGERILALRKRNAEALAALGRVGSASSPEIHAARAEIASAEAAALSIRKSIRETETALSALLAEPSAAIARGALREQRFPETLAVGVPVRLLANRPDVRQAERELAHAFYAVNVARAAFYPNLTLSGSAGWTNAVGETVVNPAGILLRAGASLASPLFDRGGNAAALKIAEARRAEAEIAFRQSVLDAGKEVNDALIRRQTAVRRETLGEARIEALKNAARETELLMRASEGVALPRVLAARFALLDAEREQARNRFDALLAAVRLYCALGGGNADAEENSFRE